MFPKLERKFVLLYTLSTGLILTLILTAAFLFYLSSQNSRQKAIFQDQLFILLSRLQTDSLFSDSYLAQIENKNHLAIYIEENDSPFFFPGSYKTRTERSRLFERAEHLAEAEGIFPNSHPISSNLLQSSVLHIAGDERDIYLGNLLIIQTSNGYKKLILLQDITGNRLQIFKTLLFYIFIDCIGILLLFAAGRWFVRRSLKPLEETYEKQQDFVAAASHELRSPLTVIQTTADAIAEAPGEGTRLLPVIKRECRRGSSLVKNLLLLASADQKQWAVKKKYFEIDEMLLNLLELYEPQCLARGGKILLELPDEPLPAVQADPDLCRQIFTILLDNAVVYGLKRAEEIHGKEGWGAEACSAEGYSAEGWGAEACSAKACGAEAWGAEACSAEAYGAEAWGAEACSAKACGAETCSAEAWGGETCSAEACGAEACSAEACGAETCSAEACGRTVNHAAAYKKAGKIILRAESSSPCVMVYIIDHGPGIPDEEKRLIFDRFYRCDKSRKQKEHFGLGLSIAAKLAEIQGIELEAADTDGGGSTFRVKIQGHGRQQGGFYSHAKR